MQGSAEAIDAVWKQQDAYFRPKDARTTFVFISFFAVVMLVVIPIWNCIWILENPTIVYFIGSSIPQALVASVVAAVLFSLGAVTIFVHFAKMEVQTTQTLSMIAMSSATLVGILFVIFSMPLRERTTFASTAIYSDCAFGTPTAPLYRTYQVLHTLRNQTDCAAQVSVEDCVGYQVTHNTHILKHMETYYRCSGFCNRPPNSARNTGSQPLPASNVIEAIPPTLFSESNFGTSCDGAVMRNLRFSVADVGWQIYGQGLGLIIVSLLVGILQLVDFCAPRRYARKEVSWPTGNVEAQPAEGYGAMEWGSVQQQQQPGVQQM